MPSPTRRGTNTPPQSDTPANPYLARLTADERAAFERAGPGLDLGEELRLFRAILATLAEDLEEDALAMATVLNAMTRAILVQARTAGQSSDLEAALIDAADLVLNGHADE